MVNGDIIILTIMVNKKELIEMVLEKLENLDKERKAAIINAALMEFATKGYD